MLSATTPPTRATDPARATRRITTRARTTTSAAEERRFLARRPHWAPHQQRPRGRAARLPPVAELPDTRYAETQDGLYIAYQAIGTGPALMALITGHGATEAEWTWPELAVFLERLASFSR